MIVIPKYFILYVSFLFPAFTSQWRRVRVEGGVIVLKKNFAFFKSRRFLVLTVFKLKPDAKYESIPSSFECFHKYISCVYCCIWSHVKVIASYCIIYSKGCVPYEGKYVVYFASPNKSIYLSRKTCPF